MSISCRSPCSAIDAVGYGVQIAVRLGVLVIKMKRATASYAASPHPSCWKGNWFDHWGPHSNIRMREQSALGAVLNTKSVASRRIKPNE
jgi:hypothetical protein